MYVGDDDGKFKKHTNGEEDVNPTKKAKQVKEFKISNTLWKLIMNDKNNKWAWTTVLESKFENHTELIEIVTFKCPVYFGLVDQPIITNCTHNICHEFLIRSTTIMGQKCPQCRTDFPANFKFNPNKKLIKALHEVIPIYDLDSSRPDKGKGGSIL